MTERTAPRRVQNIFTGETAMSKIEFQQAEQFNRAIKSEIQSNTQAVIGSAELISGAVDRLSATTERANEMISDQTERMESALGDINDSISEISDAIYWGISAITEKLDVLDASIQELIRVAKTPSQVWALEQFEISRDEYRRKLFPESLESIKRAIEGFGSQPGYRTDYRFHALMGVLQLGSFDNSDEDVVNLEQAERAFLDAARYARADAPEASGEALLSAGRAALRRGDFQAACEHTQLALRIGPTHHRKYYQLGLASAGAGDAEGVAAALTEAFVQLPLLALEAAHEALLSKAPGTLDQSIATARDRMAVSASSEFILLERACRELTTVSAAPLQDVPEKALEIAMRDGSLAEISEYIHQNTLLSLFEAKTRIEKEKIALKDSLNVILSAFDRLFSNHAEKLRLESLSRASIADSDRVRAGKIRDDKAPFAIIYFFLFGIILLGWDVVKLFGDLARNGPIDGGANLVAIWHAILRALLYVVIAPIAGWVAGAIHNGIIEGNAKASDASAQENARKRATIEVTLDDFQRAWRAFKEQNHAPLVSSL